MKNNNKAKLITADETVSSPFSTGYPTPLRILIITLTSIFIAELVVMFLLTRLPPIPETLEMFVDSFLLVILVCPVLYFFFLSPILLNITERKLLEKKLSLTDELTCLYNRRGLSILAEHQLKIANRQNVGAFVLYSILENLQEINDRWGRKEGERALVDLAHLLKRQYRKSDIIARIRENEFVVFPVGTVGDRVEKISARFQKALEMYNTKSDRGYTLSLSAGVAYYDPMYPCSIDELLAQAVKAIHEQQAGGKKA